jgi:NAD(P)H-hydrate repair Nnr-like enzyme with NAD(P)H-hydrate dehydratase domain
MLTGILAQQNLGSFAERVMFAVYLHGLAGDLGAEEVGEESWLLQICFYYIGQAWEQIRE